MFIHSACVDYFEMEMVQFGEVLEEAWRDSKSRKASSIRLDPSSGYQFISQESNNDFSTKTTTFPAHPKFA
jgi:hypothetical protein